MPTVTSKSLPRRIPRVASQQKLENDENLERASDEPKLQVYREAIESGLADMQDHVTRVEMARDWWDCKWEGQTRDGRKWSDKQNLMVFPWEGASDTRPHFSDRWTGYHVSIAMAALKNMRIKVTPTQQIEGARQGQQMTQLLKWQIGTHMLTDNNRELPLLMNYRYGDGCGILSVEWDQARRIDEVPVMSWTIEAFLQYHGENVTLDEIVSMIMEEDEMIPKILQAMSPILSTGKARSLAKDLRQLSSCQLPVPYVYRSQPRWTARRPGYDIYFPKMTGDLQRSRFQGIIERVTETELVDRIASQNYDADFVDKVLDHRGPTSLETTRTRTAAEQNDLEEKFELHHFYHYALYRSTPVLYCTLMHMDVMDAAGKHGPYGYAHGQYPTHPFRFETRSRELLSSRGIPELIYTAEQEIKKQRDGRTDLVDLHLRPPMFADHRDVEKIYAAFEPGVIYPERRGETTRWMQPPAVSNASVEIENNTKQDTAELFYIVGPNLDEGFKQIRIRENADFVLDEMNPALRQTLQLDQQFLPDDQVARVVGTLARPFQVDREQIQGSFDLTATVDMRNEDIEYKKEKFGGMQMLASIDRAGRLDWGEMVEIAAELWDYQIADRAIKKDMGEATDKEVEDERNAVMLIVGSGMEAPFPKAGNFQLRLQVMQNTVAEEAQSNPDFKKRLEQFPNIIKALQNRAKYYMNQIQQYDQTSGNPAIGRSLATKAFSSEAPMLTAGVEG